MKQYIDKSIIETEINNWIKDESKKYNLSKVQFSLSDIIKLLQKLLSFIDTIEKKEINLDESARNYLLHEHISPLNEVLHKADLKVEIQYHKDIENAYKAGFELRIKEQKIRE